MKIKKAPERVCVGCELLKPKRELLRVVLSPEGEIDLDKTGKKAGRGAYLCPKQECLDKAYKAKRLERSLKHAVSKDIYEKLKDELED